MELAGALSCVARAVLVRQRRAAWTLIAIAAVSWLIGDTIWTMTEQQSHYPAVAHAFYLAWYPLCGAGIVLLLAGSDRRVGRRLWLDGAIGGLALAAVATALLYETLLRTSGTDGLQTFIELAYPIGDLALVGLVLVAFATQGWRPSPGWLLLGAGAALIAAADALYLVELATGGYREGSLTSVLWPIAMICWAWAAWQPWTPVGAGRVLRHELFVFPAGFALAAVAVLFYGQLRDLPLPASLLALAALIVALHRASSNFREHMTMLARSQQEARTDTLTGLPNRRQLMDDLADGLADGALSRTRTLAFFDLDGFKPYNDRFGHLAGDIVLARVAHALGAETGRAGAAYRLGGDEFCLLLDGRHEADGELLRRCRAALASHGEGFELTASLGAVVLPAEARTPSDALGLADARMYAEKSARPVTCRGTCDVLMQVLREREPELRDHSDSVTAMALAVGRRLGLGSERLDELARAAELHDIGKIAIPESVLHKAGPLDDCEWDLMRQHTVIGDRILQASPAMRPVARLVRASHERWDGGGYPDRLAGEEIPLGARIVAVCDSYSAMTSERPYQLPATHAEAIAELRRCAGAQFDPAVVDAFCAVTFTAVVGPPDLRRAA
ncbi:diguanylate cyclase [Conexibacter sp. JD483]|uniref:bifunctional diguanylate cyclase/phosphohydrolase n=1 Tax=unclassified Conexibacter TaxID=2627773 RepID=UPI0027161772|nr:MULTISPECIES: diguanylate cyclase [unclassified Conexibacter]MDO8185631.1 diguanylate cyclase [Conexibacter sp. CPCC 205706]MDO8198804.1 diguanylate cyclase [Conexibacter sp. CPCC 205762]MDR9367846.1 diguanylate cyclase [Conexibacter sp. JD483]